MADNPPIRLRYFDARGRAQFLRAYMTVRGIDFDDERVALDEGFKSWSELRANRALSGPLQRLPVLHYGDDLIPETFVIAGFLHRTFGDAVALDSARNLQHDVLVSTGLVDLMASTATLIWAEMLFPGVDMGACARNNLTRLSRTLDVIDKALTEWNWVATMAERPVTVADCLLWEELDKAAVLFGPHLSLDDKPELARFRAEHPARRRFEKLLSARPSQITGRPGEPAAIAGIQAVLAEP